MQNAPRYTDVVAEVQTFFTTRLVALVAAGIDQAALCFDPGIGFGKTLEHNLALLRALGQLSPAGRPLLLGVSRKSFIGQIIGSGAPLQHDGPTVAITALARAQGVMLHRVHAVRPNLEALRITEAMLGPGTTAIQSIS